MDRRSGGDDAAFARRRTRAFGSRRLLQHAPAAFGCPCPRFVGAGWLLERCWCATPPFDGGALRGTALSRAGGGAWLRSARLRSCILRPTRPEGLLHDRSRALRGGVLTAQAGPHRSHHSNACRAGETPAPTKERLVVPLPASERQGFPKRSGEPPANPARSRPRSAARAWLRDSFDAVQVTPSSRGNLEAWQCAATPLAALVQAGGVPMRPSPGPHGNARRG